MGFSVKCYLPVFFFLFVCLFVCFLMLSVKTCKILMISVIKNTVSV